MKLEIGPRSRDYSPADALPGRDASEPRQGEDRPRGEPRGLHRRPAVPDGRDRLQGRSAGRREDRLELRLPAGRATAPARGSATRTGTAASSCRSTTRAPARLIAALAPRRARVREQGRRPLPRREAEGRVRHRGRRAVRRARASRVLNYRYKSSDGADGADEERRHVGVRADAPPRAPHLDGAAHRRRLRHGLHVRRPAQLRRHRAAVQVGVSRRAGRRRAGELARSRPTRTTATTTSGPTASPTPTTAGSSATPSRSVRAEERGPPVPPQGHLHRQADRRSRSTASPTTEGRALEDHLAQQPLERGQPTDAVLQALGGRPEPRDSVT